MRFIGKIAFRFAEAYISIFFDKPKWIERMWLWWAQQIGDITTYMYGSMHEMIQDENLPDEIKDMLIEDPKVRELFESIEKEKPLLD